MIETAGASLNQEEESTMSSELVYRIALSLVPGVGPVKARNLIAFCGSAEAVFREKRQLLLRIPDIGEITAGSISKSDVMDRAAEEEEFIRKYKITPTFFTDKNYPERLKSCEDAPILLYMKGDMDVNAEKIVSIVGTRKATAYGRKFCEDLIEGMKPHNPTIVSGLAFGIDICCHRAAIANGLSTIACLAHGLHTLYPSEHSNTAKEMLKNGGLVTEFISGTKPDPPLFPSRNRVIAGMADCTIVVESDVKGGSLITAYVANSYGRDVFAVPGRATDKYSSGCHALIKKNIAAVLTSVDDLLDYMNWREGEKPAVRQTKLFEQLSPDESEIVKILNEKGKTAIDVLSAQLEKPASILSGILLEMEFRGIVKSLPGKMYEVV